MSVVHESVVRAESKPSHGRGGSEGGALSFPSRDWALDPSLTFLNHGSYGSVPRAVLEVQSEYRARMERDPVRFFKVELERLMDEVRERIGAFVGCRPQDIAPMPNATVGLNTVLQNAIESGVVGVGDEVLVTDHEYMSIVNEMERVLPRIGARVVKAAVPFPIQNPEQVVSAVRAAVTPRTKLAIIAHLTSATSLIFPITAIVRELMSGGVEVCVDGAHTPGQMEMDIRGLAPTYYVGSFHKWLSAPKGTGFLYVRADKQAGFRPLSLSSRAHKIRPERALFLRDFDYVGTDDYTGMLAVPKAIEVMGSMLAGGWPALYRRNHELVMEGRAVVCRALGVEAPAPESMIATMATVTLPEPAPELLNRPTLYDDPLQDELVANHKVVAPVWRLSADNRRVLRLSAQVYNTRADYEKLGAALVEELAREQRRKVSA